VLQEVMVQNKCYQLGISPRIIEAWLCPNGGVIIMEKLTTTVAKLLKEYKSVEVRTSIILEVLLLLAKMHEHGIYHGDSHTENFMVRSQSPVEYTRDEKKRYRKVKYKFFAIDFGSVEGATAKGDYIIFSSCLRDILDKTQLIEIYKSLSIFQDDELERIFQFHVTKNQANSF
jgi:tRNA A-37 threonylcarbamoyl transferase component Bud32